MTASVALPRGSMNRVVLTLMLTAETDERSVCQIGFVAAQLWAVGISVGLGCNRGTGKGA